MHSNFFYVRVRDGKTLRLKYTVGDLQPTDRRTRRCAQTNGNVLFSGDERVLFGKKIEETKFIRSFQVDFFFTARAAFVGISEEER